MARLYALSNVARSNATRSDDVAGTVFIAIDGVEVGHLPAGTEPRALFESLGINERVDESANTAQLRVIGNAVQVGSEVVMRVGSRNNDDPIFAGRVLSLQQGYHLQPTHPCQDLSLIDYTWGLNARVVSERLTGTATAIAAELLAIYAPDYSPAAVAPDLPEVEGGITFTNQSLTSALTQLAKRVGATWFCDYRKVIHMTRAEVPDPTLAAPQDLVASNPLFLLDGFSVNRDLSQMVTRVYVEAGGTNAAESIRPGETIIPVTDASWYEAEGGQVVAGPQRIAYTERELGIGGSLVGPGAAPTTGPVATHAAGDGIETGIHDYAVSYATASGESVVGPRTSVLVGVVPPPPAAPGFMAAGPGADGPDPGVHAYAVTYTTATGETTIGPAIWIDTPTSAPPTKAGTATIQSGAGLDAGEHDYALTYYNAGGETTPGPYSALITAEFRTGPAIAEPSSDPTLVAITGSGLGHGLYRYRVTFGNAVGETVGGPDEVVTTKGPHVATPPGFSVTSLLFVYEGFDIRPGLTVGATYQWGFGWKRTSDGLRTAIATPILHTGVFASMPTPGTIAWPWSGSGTIPPTGCVAQFYRTKPNGSTFYEITVGDYFHPTGGASKYDTTFDSALTVPGPTSSETIELGRVQVSNLPVGGSGTTKRYVYRSAVGGDDSDMRRVHTANNNSAGYSFNDSVFDGGRGAAIPTSNTTAVVTYFGKGHLTSLPVPTDASISGKALYRRPHGGGLQHVTDLAVGVTSYDDTAPNAALGDPPTATNGAYLQYLQLRIPVAPPLATGLKLYGSQANQIFDLFYIADVSADGIYVVTISDTALIVPPHVFPPVVNTATANQMDLSDIPTGPAAVISRSVYRTAADDPALQLLTVLADNTTTTWHDEAADSTLGALAPTSDLSGLTQPQGVVLPGVSTLTIASTRDFLATGGWAIIGNGAQIIRYTGLGGAQQLVGIPETGVGAITASVTFGSTITPNPHLAGIPASGSGAIRYGIVRGDPVNLWIPIDDLDAQAALIDFLGGGDGLVEDYLQDRRLSAAEGRSRGTAHLAERNQVLVTVRYRTRDRNTRAGAQITISLPAPTNVTGTFTIQSVQIGQFFATPTHPPTFSVEASTNRFSFDDLLRLSQVPGSAGKHMAITITRTPWIDDDGSGTTGTVLNNAAKTDLYNQIDGALALVPAVALSGFEPALLAGGAATSPTYVKRAGRLTRIGTFVFCQIDIVLSSKGAAGPTGAVTVAGLPLTTTSTPDINVGTPGYMNGLAVSYAWIGMAIVSSSTSLRMIGTKGPATTIEFLQWADLADGFEFYGSILFNTATP